MALEIVTVPCLSDNYAFLLHDGDSGQTAVIDVPDAAPLLHAARGRGWTIGEVWITHHHADHVQGLEDLLGACSAIVRGAAADAHRLPPLDAGHAAEDLFGFAGHPVRVIDVPGHTRGHIAYYVEGAAAVFTADSLMALGCGRLFEGTAEEMWTSLTRLMALPEKTLICSGHEYTAANGKFALTIDPDNPELRSRCNTIDAARAAGDATVPSKLSLELATNPFLRASDPRIRARLDMTDAADVAVFAEIRARKDAF